MVHYLLRRRASRFAIALSLLASIVPFGVLADHHEATRTPATFITTVVEVLDEGESWTDEAGIFHIRGGVQTEEISGDISGTAVVVFNLDSFAPGECTEEACPAYTEVWGTVEITGEDGGWEGAWMISASDVPGEEYYFTSIVLRGTGANAGMSFVGEFTEETETSATIEGVISTLGLPLAGLNTNVRLCADPEDFSFAGGFLSSGAIEGHGGAAGEFYISGGPWTHTYAATGRLTLTDEQGSVTIVFTGGAQDNFTPMFQASHFWGHFVIVEGTGDYADLYGSGRLVGTAGGPESTCASGFGIGISMVGGAHYN